MTAATESAFFRPTSCWRSTGPISRRRSSRSSKHSSSSANAPARPQNPRRFRGRLTIQRKQGLKQPLRKFLPTRDKTANWRNLRLDNGFQGTESLEDGRTALRLRPYLVALSRLECRNDVPARHAPPVDQLHPRLSHRRNLSVHALRNSRLRGGRSGAEVNVP